MAEVVSSTGRRGVVSELYTARAQTTCLLPCRALPCRAALPPLSVTTRFSPTSSEELRGGGGRSSKFDGQSSSSGRLPSLSGSPKTPSQWRHRGTENQQAPGKSRRCKENAHARLYGQTWCTLHALALLLFSLSSLAKGSREAQGQGSPCSSTHSTGDSSCCELRSSLRGSVVAPVPYRVGLALRPGTTKNSARRRLCSCCYGSRQRLQAAKWKSWQFSRKKK